MTDVAALEAREQEVRRLAEVLAQYDGDDLTTLFLGNFRHLLEERDAAREEIERLKGLRAEAARMPWSFHQGSLRERLEWCGVQHQIAAANPPLHPPTREQKADFDRACVDWYGEMVTQCDELALTLIEYANERDVLRGYVEEIKKLASDPFASEVVALRACLLAANEALGLPGPEPSPERDIARAIIKETL